VGATGFEPVTSSVSGHARPFTRSVAAVHGTTSALLRRVTNPGIAMRREAADGSAADKLLTAGHEPRSIWRTSVRARRPMADRCSFCGSTAGPFSRVEGLFAVLMCADCQAARGHGSGPYPVMTRAEMRAGLDPAPHLGAGTEGGRQPPGHRSHAPTAGRRRAGSAHVPGARAGLAGTPSRGGRRTGSSAEANSGEPPRIMTAWVGRLELCPTSGEAAWWWLCWHADLRFLLAGHGHPCPLHSASCRLPVYPSCTGPGPSGR
jgi:hypothetical protein